MQFLIITGMSGAGKSHCVKYFEDIGFYCVDNLPPSLIPTFAMLSRQSGNMDKVALIVDIRGGDMFQELFPALEQLTMLEIPYRILFLDAGDEVLIKRFKETRRMHPLAQDGRVQDGITQEREILKPVRARADVLIDTSNMLPRQLRETILRHFVEGKTHTGLTVNILSFGFKYGIPLDADLVFDVRFIPNPYYIEALKPLTGLDHEVSDYVMAQPESVTFLDKLRDMVSFLMPYYVKEGKSQLVIAIGCTGGKHRSVTLAIRLAGLLQSMDATVVLEHRDIDRDGKAAKA
jgi:UPF0042 nucleotide-binding protein